MKQDTCTNVGKHALGYVFSKSYMQESQGQINQFFSQKLRALFCTGILFFFPDSDHKP